MCVLMLTVNTSLCCFLLFARNQLVSLVCLFHHFRDTHNTFLHLKKTGPQKVQRMCSRNVTEDGAECRQFQEAGASVPLLGNPKLEGSPSKPICYSDIQSQIQTSNKVKDS
jgi:hypothetical protein